ncbi:MAG: hydantoinase/oxoprolinase family protein [Gammaproteobacteria bacterium]|nr:hydantoinase/oxoprolinase family protein [Gammaproteobacteria bacterium]
MGVKIGIDVGGTFTDFLVAWGDREPEIFKVLSTPSDPSLGVLDGLHRIAASQQPPQDVNTFIGDVDTIVHGTTVTTNATLTRKGAKSALLTTAGVRDALEMRRGVREEQYNNRYTNVTPLVPRYLRAGVGGRVDRDGRELDALRPDDLADALELFRQEGVESVSICFLNAFANPAHEQQAAAVVRAAMPHVYLTVSTALLPSIRFYDRLSTTALNSYVGPILSRYLDQLTERLRGVGFRGTLLIMQSNGGVMVPEVARDKAALTLLSGPAAGPGAGQVYARAHGRDDCIVVDMGGTSFEASLVSGAPLMVNEGIIDRHRIALPMLGIHTIGAGGGSLGWIDEGGLLRMGPQSAGADPGPACYGRGGTLPTCTDANLVLGYLDPDFFAGGTMALDLERARCAIGQHVAARLGLSIEEAAAGMYRVVCNNMAQGIREVSIKRGFDPREFPLIVAGGAGPIHSCLICEELEMPFQIVPRESSILCAVGMLLGDLIHDFVRTHVCRLEHADWPALERVLDEMTAAGRELLQREGIPEQHRSFQVKFDCRYLKQFHEVSFAVPQAAIAARDAGAIARAFHLEHNRLYGYSLEELRAPVEIINVRVQAIGRTDKPEFSRQPHAGADPAAARRGERPAYLPGARAFRSVPIYDGHRLRHGNEISGPAIIEEATTTIFVSENFDCVTDALGSFALHRKGRADPADGAHGADHDAH